MLRPSGGEGRGEGVKMKMCTYFGKSSLYIITLIKLGSHKSTLIPFIWH